MAKKIADDGRVLEHNKELTQGMSRRDVVGKLAIGTAGAAVVWVVSGGKAVATSSPQDALRKVSDIAATIPTSGEPSGPSAADRGVVDAMTANADGSAPWGILRPLTLGATAGAGWRVAHLSEIRDGACVVTLQNQRGRSHRVHICSNTGTPQGLVYTEKFDLIVMNGGQGDLPTEEGFAQAVIELAHVLAANERSASSRVADTLLAHSERLEMFAGGEDRRLR